jgi:tRNA dimethylallyltransferase
LEEDNQKLNAKKTLIVIVGPTAVGKTALAIKVAQHFHTEIISADSRQFFKEIAIGTAKPDASELAIVKHHFIDSHSLTDDIDAGIFERDAIDLLNRLFKKKSLVIMVGGSGLYIDAVCKGLDELPVKDEAIRKELHQKSLQELQQELQQLDPEYYSIVDQNNTQRLMRAIEVCRLTGKPFTKFRKGEKKKRDFNIIKIGLNKDRKLLYEQIDKRVDMMMESGLLNEVRSVEKYRNTYALQTVGYSELFDHIDGKISLEEAVELIKRNTRRFAKRQLTWFKRDEETQWFEPDDTEKIINYIEQKT